MDLSKLSQHELQTRCAWGHQYMPEDEECFGAGAKLNPAGKRMIEGREGTLTTLKAPDGHEIIVIVPTKESDARRAGNDIFFQACSEVCCEKISAALRV
jgi:hypothetical protein